MQQIDYQELDRGLTQASCELDAAEVHGLLCGLICAKGTVNHKQWLNEVLENWDPNDVLAREVAQKLSLLHIETLKDLNDPELKFSLLLPDDSTSLNMRIDALSHWCEGFLFGLAQRLKEEELEKYPQIREAVADIQQISQVGEAEEGDSSEADLFEITEYIRLAVLMIYDTLQPVQQSAPRIQ